MQGAAVMKRRVWKTMDLLDGEDAVGERAEHDPAAFGAKVAGKMMGRHFRNHFNPV